MWARRSLARLLLCSVAAQVACVEPTPPPQSAPALPIEATAFDLPAAATGQAATTTTTTERASASDEITAQCALAGTLWRPPEPEPADPGAAPAEDAEPADEIAPDEGDAAPVDRCANTPEHLARARAAVLATPAVSNAPREWPAWDHRSRPAALDLVKDRLGLGDVELAALAHTGFAQLDRLVYDDYAWAFHDVYRLDLPLYVSVDAILHAIYVGHDRTLKALELNRLVPATRAVLDALACALPAVADAYPEAVAHDVDTYLAVARSLIAEDAVSPALPGTDGAAVDALVDHATRADGFVTLTLFGRERRIDFSQFEPRGHYAPNPIDDGERQPLVGYFRAAMWLSRIELNLASRGTASSSPAPHFEETPREALVALALADLAERAGVLADVARLDRAWGLFAGRREDVGLDDLTRLADEAKVSSLRAPDTFARFRAVLGDRFPATVRTHFMPLGSGDELPATAAVMGPRVTADAQATMSLVSDAIPDRDLVHAADFAFMLGHDRALRWLGGDLEAFPGLRAGLDRARAIVAAERGHDLYARWLGAIAGLAAPLPAGSVTPSFMATEAFADKRVDSAVVAFAQLRHNHVLLAAQVYEKEACSIPDAYVEPAPATYAVLLDFAREAARAFHELDPGGAGEAYYVGVVPYLEALAAIGARELTGQPLTAAMRDFLALVVEVKPRDYGGDPENNGWYFHLFPDNTPRDRGHFSDSDAFEPASFVVDVQTSPTAGEVAYLGARAPTLGAFVVDVGGRPRVVVGPLARGYETRLPIDGRLTDELSRTLEPSDYVAPWRASYAVTDPRGTLPVAVAPEADDPYQARSTDLRVVAGQPMRATLELLGRGRERLARRSVSLGPKVTRVHFGLVPLREVQRVRLVVGDRRLELDCDVLSLGASCGAHLADYGALVAPLSDAFEGHSETDP